MFPADLLVIRIFDGIPILFLFIFEPALMSIMSKFEVSCNFYYSNFNLL